MAPRASEWKQLWRYYQAGVVNTAFGYGLFALLLAAGANVYAAQIIAHVIGAAFNYLTFSRHAFAHAPGSKSRFFLSYAANYLIALGLLRLLLPLLGSPYLAGLVTTLTVSLVNFFILKRLVFVDRPARQEAR